MKACMRLVNLDLCLFLAKPEQYKRYFNGLEWMNEDKYYLLKLHRNHGLLRFIWNILKIWAALNDPTCKPEHTFYPES